MLQGTIQGLSSLKVFYHYMGVPASMDSYSLQVYTKLPNQEKYVLLQGMSYKMSQHISFEFQLWNIQVITIDFVISFTSNSNQSLTNTFNNSDPTHNATYIQMQLVQQQIANFHFISIIIEDDLANLMLPFNLINPKLKKVFVTIINQTLKSTSYKIQPFLSTFWNQYGFSVTALPWIPFLSQCTIQSSRIMTGQLMYPLQCNITYPFSIQLLSCNNKIVEFKCLLEELNVANPRGYPWFNSYTDPIYYMYPKMIINSELGSFIDNNAKISTLINQVNSLIPVKLINNVGIDNAPNQIFFNFGVQISSIQDISIIYATVTLNFNNQVSGSASLAQNQAKIIIEIEYLDPLDSFYYLAAEPQIYLSFFLLCFLFMIILRQLFLNLQIQLKFEQKVLIFFGKILKGFLLFSSCSFSFILGFYYISKLDYFSAISTHFSSLSTSTQGQTGRAGLVVMICGIYLLNSGINQAFKIDTENQIKIYIQDELQKNQQFQQQKNTIQFQQKLNQKQIFIRQNLSSRRKYLLISMLLVTAFLLLQQYQMIKIDYIRVSVILLFFHPLQQKLCWSFFKFYCLQQMIYSFIILVAFETTRIFYFMLATTLFELLILNLASLVGSLVVHFALQLLFQQLAVKLKYGNSESRIRRKLYQFFQEEIDSTCNQSVYQRSLSYSAILHSKMVYLYLQPLLFLLVYCTIDQNQIYEDLFVNKDTIRNIAIIQLSFFCLHIFLIFLVQTFLQKFFHLKITQTVQFGGFRFKKRSIRWMNDIFHQNSSIYFFYREFQKFNFSSQLYLVSCMIAFSMCSITISIRMIISSEYIMFADPALMLLIFLIYICGEVLSIIISFLALKLKLYENKDRVQSKSTLKGLSKILENEQHLQYLQLDRVKDFFMLLNKDWIITKIQKIIEKEDRQKDSKFLIKYNLYKSYLKKFQVEQRRVPRNSIVGNDQLLQKLKSLKYSPSIFKVEKKLFDENLRPLILNGFILLSKTAI